MAGLMTFIYFTMYIYNFLFLLCVERDPASGNTADYFYDTTGIPCTFTAELRDTGEYGFLLPPDQIRSTAEEVFAGFKVMAEAIINGHCTSK